MRLKLLGALCVLGLLRAGAAQAGEIYLPDLAGARPYNGVAVREDIAAGTSCSSGSCASVTRWKFPKVGIGSITIDIPYPNDAPTTGTPFTCEVGWHAPVTSGAVFWNLDMSLLPLNGTLTYDDLGTTGTTAGVASTVAAVANADKKVVFGATAPGGTLATNTHIRVRISRFNINGADTMAGDAFIANWFRCNY